MAGGGSRTNGDARPLILINGLGVPRLVAQAYAVALRAQGLRAYTAASTVMGFGDIREAARRVGDRVRSVRAKTGAEKIDLLGISLGGLIGLYYIKCGGGAEHVHRFISLGGPLNGSPVAKLSTIPPIRFVTSIRQTHPESDVISEIRAAQTSNGVRMFSLGAPGDFLTPPESRSAEGFETVDLPIGFFPFGHWCVFLSRRNQQKILELLRAG